MSMSKMFLRQLNPNARMKQCGYWGKNDRTVRTHGFIYNIDHTLAGDLFSQAALTSCSCSGNHGQKKGR